MSQAAPIVEARKLNYSVNGRAIFSGLDLDILPGRITAIMGPSGTGKTTLLRLITGQLRANGGELTVAGRDMRTLRRSDLYELRKRMGMLFQNGALLTDLSVFENVAFPLREHTDLPERLIRVIVLTKLQAVGLRGAAELMPSELSGGMGRRVAPRSCRAAWGGASRWRVPSSWILKFSSTMSLSWDSIRSRSGSSCA